MRKFLLLILCSMLSLSLEASVTADMKRQRINEINRFHIGIGTDCLLGNNTSIGGELQFRIGHNHQPLNFVLIAKHSWHNRIKLTDSPYLISNQLSTGMGLRENLIRKQAFVFYVMESLLFEFPYKVSYCNQGSKILDNKLMRNYLGAYARLGIVRKQMDLSVFIRASLWPEYDQKYIYESYIYDYYRCRPMIDSRISFGLSLIYHIDL